MLSAQGIAVSGLDLHRSKKETRELLEKRKQEEAERERIRQQKRINFLLTQTELFAHFIGQKMGSTPSGATGASAGSEVGSGGGTNPSAQNQQNGGELDREETKQAIASAQLALQNRADAVRSFDAGVARPEGVPEGSRKLPRKTDQAIVQGLESTALHHEDVAQTNEVAKIFQGTLKPYQVIGFNWLVGLYEQGLNGILADEMGLGKTVQTISLLSFLAEKCGIWGPFLVVAPTSTMHNWCSEMEKFCPRMKVIPYFGANPNERKLLRRLWSNTVALGTPDAPFHVLVTNYKLVISDEKHFARVTWQYMVLDEAQAIKSSASQRWKTLLGFKCRNRLLLTGTPIQNSMAELWALLHFIMPELFDSFSDFTDWFSKDIESSAEGKGGGMDQQQLRRLQLILQPFMLRRTKKEVLNEMVHKVEIEVRSPLSSRQKYYYDMLKRRVTSAAELSDKMLSRDENRLHSLMNLVMQFRKVCNHPEIFERRDFLSPLQLQQRTLPSLPLPSGEAIPVTVCDISEVTFSLPQMIYESLVDQRTWSGLNAPLRAWVTTTLLSPWVAGHVQTSTSLSWFRLLNLSSAEFCFLARASGGQRWLASATTNSRQAALMCTGSLGGEIALPWERGSQRPTVLIRTRQEWLEQSWEGELVVSASRRLYNLRPQLKLCMGYTPRVSAAPAHVYCASAHHAAAHAVAMRDEWTRRLVLGGVSQGGLLLHELDALAAAVPPASLPGPAAEGPSSPSLLRSFFQAVGSSSVQVPDFARLVTDAGKLRILDSLLPRLKAEGHRVLLFCQMTKMMDILEDYLWYRKHRYLRLDGSASIADRRDMVNDFQAEGSEYFIFMLSTRAGGLGINLTAADTVIFYDSDWNPTMDAQAMDRAHRLGQKKEVTVYRLVTARTIEERILHRAKQKHSIQQMVIAGEGAAGAFKGTGASDFRAADFAELLFEEDETVEDTPGVVASSTREAGSNEEKKIGTETGASEYLPETEKSAPAKTTVKIEAEEKCVKTDANVEVANQEHSNAGENCGESTDAKHVIGEWLRISQKVEVEWEGDWWDASVKDVTMLPGGRRAKVLVVYAGATAEEEEEEWIEATDVGGLVGWISGRLREHVSAAAMVKEDVTDVLRGVQGNQPV